MIAFPSHRLEQSWFIKYKLYHFPFWAAYFFMSGVLELGFWEVIGTMSTPRFLMYLNYIVIHTFAVYFNLYYLLPKYLEKGKLSQYILSLACWITFTAIILMLSYYPIAYIIGKDLMYFCGFDVEPGLPELFGFFLKQALPASAVTLLIGLCIKLTKNWSLAQKKQQILEKEKLETELNFLKYQFNPHFLFNTINSIFFLIHKDPTMASTALAKFSELLRYQLYECNETQIPLSNEIGYLENFVALEKLRRSEDFQVELEINHQNKGNLGVASFILMTFVENAFKHVSKHRHKPNWVVIKLDVLDKNRLNFEVINSTSKEDHLVKEAVKYGGLGLKNVKRRLDLIYPEQYELSIENQGDTFSIKLQLKLNELPKTAAIYPPTQLVGKF